MGGDARSGAVSPVVMASREEAPATGRNRRVLVSYAGVEDLDAAPLPLFLIRP